MTKRQPRGVPVGGQFAADARGESEAVLNDGSPVAQVLFENIPGTQITIEYNRYPVEATGVDAEIPLQSLGSHARARRASAGDPAKRARADVAFELLLRDRYGETFFDARDDGMVISWQYEVPGHVTAGEARTAVLVDTRGPQALVRDDASGALTGSLATRLRRSASVREPSSAYAESSRFKSTSLSPSEEAISDANLEIFVSDPDADVPLPTDEAVRHYAYRWAGNSREMGDLNETGSCDAQKALQELDAVAPISSSRGTLQERFQASQISRWIEASQKSMAEEWRGL